jgi:DNA-binding MarR family transcriptional regulator
MEIDVTDTEIETPWFETVSYPALLRLARTTYGAAMRRSLEAAGFDDIPGNGLFVIGGLALGTGDVPLGALIADLGMSKQAAGQLVDTLVLRGYLIRAVDPDDRRKLVVKLTDRGQAAAAAQTAGREEVDAALQERVGEKAVMVSRKVLAALIGIGRPEEQHED